MKRLALILFVACLAVTAKAQQSTNFSSYTLTNKLAATDRLMNSDINRASGDRTKTILATNVLPALLLVPQVAIADPDVTLSRRTNAATGLGVAITTHTNSSVFKSLILSTNISVRVGSGSPESAVTADIGSLWIRYDGGAQGTVLYLKTNGTGSTGWWGVQ